MRRIAIALAGLLCTAAAPVPPETLPDPAAEARARALFREVRCVVCQNESIDGSQADIAADLRVVVREQVAEGRSDDEIRAYLVARYGEFVLFRPAFSLANAALWLTPFAVAALGGGVLLARRGRRCAPANEAAVEPWSPAELPERDVS